MISLVILLTLVISFGIVSAVDSSNLSNSTNMGSDLSIIQVNENANEFDCFVDSDFSTDVNNIDIFKSDNENNGVNAINDFNENFNVKNDELINDSVDNNMDFSLGTYINAYQKVSDKKVYASADDKEIISAVSGGTFSAIQSAINSASAGSTIRLSGTYTGSGSEITVNKKINIVADSSGAVLDAKSSSGFFVVYASGVSFQNIFFKNGINTSEKGTLYFDKDSSSNTVNNCTFYNCNAEKGGGIYMKGTGSTISNCTFIKCTASKEGGAICLDKENNKVLKSLFINCSSSDEGGAIHCKDTGCTINYCIFENCRASLGDCIYHKIKDGETINLNYNYWGQNIPSSSTFNSDTIIYCKEADKYGHVHPSIWANMDTNSSTVKFKTNSGTDITSSMPYYGSSSSTTSYNTTLTVSTTDISYGSDEVLTVSLTASNGAKLNTTINLFVDGSNYTISISKGTGFKIISSPSIGSHTVSASYGGNSSYESSTWSGSFSVSSSSPIYTTQLNLTNALDVTYPYYETMHFSLFGSDGTGLSTNITVIIDSTYTYKSVITNGYGNLIINKDSNAYSMGYHTVNASFAGNSIYASSSNSSFFRVNSEDIINTSLLLSTNDIIYGNDEVINISLIASNGAKLNATLDLVVDGVSYPISISNGQASKTIIRPSVASHNVSVSYGGNSSFTSSFNSTSFTVYPNQTRIDTFLEISTSNIEYGRHETMNLSLYDANGKGLNANVTLYVDSNKYTVPISDGHSTFLFTNPSNGTHYVNASFEGNYSYYPAICYASFKVGSVEKMDPIMDAYFDGYSLVVTLTDSDYTLINGTVKAIVNAKEYPISINNGYGHIAYDEAMGLGEKPVTVIYNGSSSHNPKTINSLVDFFIPSELIESNLSIIMKGTYESGQIITVKINLTDLDDGAGINGTIHLYISNKNDENDNFFFIVDAVDGIASRDIRSLNAGTYNLIAFYPGDSDYEANYSFFQFEVKESINKKDSYLNVYSDEEGIHISLMDDDSNYLNKTIYISLDDDLDYEKNAGGEYIIDLNGETLIPIGPLSEGTKNLTVGFNGDDEYKSFEETVEIEIIKSSKKSVYLDILLSSANYEHGDSVPVLIILMDGNNNYVSGNITLSLNSSKSFRRNYNIEIIDGFREYLLKNLDCAEYQVNAKIDETADHYSYKTEDKKFNITKSVILDIDSNDTDIKISLTDDDNNPLNASINISIDGNKNEIEIKNGEISIPLSDFTDGNHLIEVSYIDGDKEIKVKTIIKVLEGSIDNNTNYSENDTKLDSKIAMSFDSSEYKYGDNVTVFLNVTGENGEKLNETLFVFLNNKQLTPIVSDNGFARLILPNLDVANYTLNVLFNGTEYYKNSFASGSFNVNKASAQLYSHYGKEAYDYGNYTYGDTVEIIFNLYGNNEKIDGNIIFEINNVSYNVKAVAGEAKLVLNDLPSATYHPNVFFEGNGMFESVGFVDLLIVNPSTDAIISAEVDDIEYGEDANILISIVDGENKPISGVVNVNIDGKAHDIEVKDGKLNLTIKGLDASKHNIVLSISGGDYVSSPLNVSIDVDKKGDADLDISSNNPKAGEKINISLAAKDNENNPLNGSAKVTVGNIVKTVSFVNGKANLILDGLDAGDYYIAVEFNNKNYLPINKTAKLSISKIDNAKLALTTSNIKESEIAVIGVKLTDSIGIGLDGLVLLKLDGTDYLVNVTGGKGTLSIKNLANGTYSIDAKSLENKNYNSVNAAGSFIVSPYSKVILNIGSHEGAIDISLTDDEGNPFNGTVNLTIDGKSQNVPVVDGKATLPVDRGSKNVTASYDGDDSHAAATKTVSITVPNSTSGNGSSPSGDGSVNGSVPSGDGSVNGSVPYGNGSSPSGNGSSDNTNSSISEKTLINSDIKISLNANEIIYGDKEIIANISLTADGKAIDGVVELSLNGKLENITVKDGKANIIFKNLAASEYTIVAQFVGKDQYSSSTASANFNVARKATKFNYSDMKTIAIFVPHDGRIGEYFYFQLVDEDGNPLANKNVGVGFNGKIYNRTTDANGSAKLQINLGTVFRYTFAISFLGDENYSAAFNIALIEVTPQSPKITTSSKTYKATAKTKTLSATFLTSSNNPVKGKKITFNVNGKSYGASTNAKGVATVKVSLTKRGTYSFTAKFSGDNTYSSKSTSAKITIK